jgi:hypothetical protein
MGQCLISGWSEDQFWLSSYRAAFNLIRARQEQEEQRYKDEWDRTRVICEYVFRPYRGKTIGPVFDLPWDSERKGADKGRVLDDEEVKQKFAKLPKKLRKQI